MKITLIDYIERESLLPLTYTRPTSDLLIGILKIKDKWDKHLKSNTIVYTTKYLSNKFNSKYEKKSIAVNSSVLPNKAIIDSIMELKENQVLINNDIVLAFYPMIDEKVFESEIKKYTKIQFNQEYNYIARPQDIFKYNHKELEYDFDLINNELEFTNPSNTNKLLGDKIFIEKNAIVECSTLNSKDGLILIRKGAEVMENTSIRGSLALLENSQLKMGSKIYGSTTIGQNCKIGGELNNVIFQGYSNKAHDGFIGNSVIGQWCNLGADTNNSNLKNNYSIVKIWNYKSQTYEDTGLTFCGMIMGDHSKTSINTMINTGTVIGVCANIFDEGFPSKLVNSFSWGNGNNNAIFQLDKAIEVAKKVYERRNIIFDKDDENIFNEIYQITNADNSKN